MFFWLAMVIAICSGGIRQGLRNGDLGEATIFGSMMIVMGAAGLGCLHLIKGELYYQNNCRYVLTDQRAMVIIPKGLFGYRAWAFLPVELKRLKRTELRADGSGTLLFRVEEGTDTKGPPITHQLGFHNVPEVEDVERRIRQMVQAVTAG